MKKQFQILAATFIMVAFISCSREKIETPVTNQPTEEATKPGGGGIVINPLSVGLLGRYEFNGTLKDTTGKLEDAWSTNGRVIFTTDRKGQANKAIRFNGVYGIDIYDIPYTPDKASVSLWVKDDIVEGPYWNRMMGSSHAFNFIQNENSFNCSFQKFGYGIIQSVSTAPIDGQWHHLAATRDNTSLKLYIDGVLIGTAPSPAESLLGALHSYCLAYGGGSYWVGSIDDVRFYKKVLSPAEVTALKNL